MIKVADFVLLLLYNTGFCPRTGVVCTNDLLIAIDMLILEDQEWPKTNARAIRNTTRTLLVPTLISVAFRLLFNSYKYTK